MTTTINASTTAGLVQTADTSGILQLQTASTAALTIDASQNSTFAGSVKTNTLTSASATALTLQSAGTTAITVDTSQNVGIGTASPSGKLHVESSSVADLTEILKSTDAVNGRSVIYMASAKNSAGTQSNVSMEAQSVSGANADLVFRTSGSNVTAGSERMRIVSSGELVVGGTTAGGVGTSIAAPDSGGIYCNTATTGARNQIRFVNPNGTVGSIQTSGSATSYNTSSDYRLKENIVPMTGALAKVAQLKPVTYKWKADGSDGEGFIAHELQTIKPNCVSGNKDAVETYTDEGGNEATRPAYQGIDTSFLVATLTAAIQELKAINDTLTARIVALETRA